MYCGLLTERMSTHTITEEVYRDRHARLRRTVLVDKQDAVAERFCDGGK
jgi:hypothetical protein